MTFYYPHVHLMIFERGLDRDGHTAEQWFRRYNAKSPEQGRVRKTRSMTGRDWLAGGG